TQGLEVMMSHGVTPRFNQWRREPQSNLVKEHDQPPIPLDLYIQLMGNRYELWKKYKLPMPYGGRLSLNAGSGYLGASHGTYNDYVLLMENAYPAGLVDLIERRSTPFQGLPQE
ncbi:MAG: hypothetical protein AAB289_11185, partial [Chloroflexota bacterium]